jgi:glutathione synthase/RimK-type ligase-like ATP-grasp enzyme
VIVVLHEHPTWSRSLFAELESRDIPFRALHVAELASAREPDADDRIVNRVGAGVTGDDRLGVLRRTAEFLRRCEERGMQIVNGTAAFRYTVSKLRQYEALDGLGLFVPPYRSFARPEELRASAAGLRFPLIFKPNVGGSGSAMRAFEDAAALDGPQGLDLGPDGTGILQELMTPDDGCIVRVEMLAGELLYALRVPVENDCFNNCPVDLGARVAVHEPTDLVIEEARRILEICSTEVGSVEYVERDGRRHYFDVNPFSNFVSNPVELLGFDPTAKFVDFLQASEQPGARTDASGRS